MSIPVVADADTLFPAATRGLLIYLDYQGYVLHSFQEPGGKS